MTRWYRSKVDPWIAAALAFGPLVSLGILAQLVTTGDLAAIGIGLLPILLLVVVYLGLLFPTRYRIDAGQLVVQHGLMKRRFPLKDIVVVTPTYDVQSAAALSLDRLRVSLTEDDSEAVLVSPADRDGFLDELADKAGLTRLASNLVRMPSAEEIEEQAARESVVRPRQPARAPQRT